MSPSMKYRPVVKVIPPFFTTSIKKKHLVNYGITFTNLVNFRLN